MHELVSASSHTIGRTGPSMSHHGHCPHIPAPRDESTYLGSSCTCGVVCANSGCWGIFGNEPTSSVGNTKLPTPSVQRLAQQVRPAHCHRWPSFQCCVWQTCEQYGASVKTLAVAVPEAPIRPVVVVKNLRLTHSRIADITQRIVSCTKRASR